MYNNEHNHIKSVAKLAFLRKGGLMNKEIEYLEVEAFFEKYKSLPVEKQKLVMEYQQMLSNKKEKNKEQHETGDVGSE